MISLDAYRAQWFSNIRADVLAGLVVALVLFPAAIDFLHDRWGRSQGRAQCEFLDSSADVHLTCPRSGNDCGSNRD